MQISKQFTSFRIILVLLMLPGLLVAVWRCSLRMMGESKNKYVDIAVDLTEFRKFAREEGVVVGDLLSMLKKNGASSIVVAEDTLEHLAEDGKITLMSGSDIRKLSLDKDFRTKYPIPQNTAGTLWIHSDDVKLIDRINYCLGLKIGAEKLIRIHQNLLLVNKSSEGITNRVGVGYPEEIPDIAAESDLGLIYRIGNYPGLTATATEKLLNYIPSPASVSAIIFEGDEAVGVRGDLQSIINLFKQKAYRLGDVEFAGQTGMDSYLKTMLQNRLVVRVHSITRKELDLKYDIKTAIFRWVRAAQERSIRILYFRCFNQHEKHLIDNLIDYNVKYLNQTAKALEKSGLKIAKSQSERIAEERNIVGSPEKSELLVIGVALLFGLALLLKTSIWQEMKNGILIALTIASICAFSIADHKKWIMGTGVVGAVTFATFGVIWALNWLQRQNRDTGFVKLLWGMLWRMVSSSMLGGILIAGIHTDVIYLLKYDQFRGVKIAFILPVLFSCLWAVKLYGGKILRWLYKPMNLFAFILVCGLALSFFFYILRSGNSTLFKPSASEESIRNYLEEMFIARPRNKEFLVGYPALFLFLFFWLRRSFAVLPLFAIFIQMGQVSVLNSMCHFHTPLKLTLLRIFNGLWLGVLFGIASVLFIAILRLFYIATDEKKKRLFMVGYFGFGNLGDELLWRTFATKFLSENKDYVVSVLYADEPTDNEENICNFISRRYFLDILDELLTCKVLVVPGGGVFQSSTSVKSLVYYLTLVSIAWLSGAKIILPSQGLGPWNTTGKSGRFALKWLGFILKRADYVSVRDENSKVEFLKLTAIPDAIVSTDLVFLGKNVNKASLRNVHKTMKIFAVLRSSVKESYEIAKYLMSLTLENEDLELYPIAMQPGEDEKVWQDLGWTAPIGSALEDGNAFGGADIVVSMRLHGCILSTIACIPWLGIAYDPKVSAYADLNGWELCVMPSDLTEERLKMLFEQMKKTRSSFSGDLHKIALHNTELAEEDYKAFKYILNNS